MGGTVFLQVSQILPANGIVLDGMMKFHGCHFPILPPSSSSDKAGGKK